MVAVDQVLGLYPTKRSPRVFNMTHRKKYILHYNIVYLYAYVCTYILEKEMATHSRILAWRIPWTEEPGRLQSMGSQELDMTE